MYFPLWRINSVNFIKYASVDVLLNILKGTLVIQKFKKKGIRKWKCRFRDLNSSPWGDPLWMRFEQDCMIFSHLTDSSIISNQSQAWGSMYFINSDQLIKLTCQIWKTETVRVFAGYWNNFIWGPPRVWIIQWQRREIWLDLIIMIGSDRG